MLSCQKQKKSMICHTLFGQTALDTWATHTETEGLCFARSDALSEIYVSFFLYMSRSNKLSIFKYFICAVTANAEYVSSIENHLQISTALHRWSSALGIESSPKSFCIPHSLSHSLSLLAACPAGCFASTVSALLCTREWGGERSSVIHHLHIQ
jgi:hypothetical protein